MPPHDIKEVDDRDKNVQQLSDVPHVVTHPLETYRHQYSKQDGDDTEASRVIHLQGNHRGVHVHMLESSWFALTDWPLELSCTHLYIEAAEEDGEQNRPDVQQRRNYQDAAVNDMEPYIFTPHVGHVDAAVLHCLVLKPLEAPFHHGDKLKVETHNHDATGHSGDEFIKNDRPRVIKGHGAVVSAGAFANATVLSRPDIRRESVEDGQGRDDEVEHPHHKGIRAV